MMFQSTELSVILDSLIFKCINFNFADRNVALIDAEVSLVIHINTFPTFFRLI